MRRLPPLVAHWLRKLAEVTVPFDSEVASVRRGEHVGAELQPVASNRVVFFRIRSRGSGCRREGRYARIPYALAKLRRAPL